MGTDPTGGYGAPETYANECLRCLESEGAALQQRILSFTVSGGDSTIPQVEAILAELRNHLTRLNGYRALAPSLVGRDGETFRQRLAEIIEYVQGKEGMYQWRARSLMAYPARPPVLPSAASLSFSEVFQHGMRRSRSLFNRSCFHCESGLGDGYFYLNVCPACGRNPRP